MIKYRFTTATRSQLGHKHWRVMGAPKENVRGLIRGASIRERGLIPGAVRSRMRRLRFRLLQMYAFRFGKDEFYEERSIARVGRPPRSKWFASGYAYWRDRYGRAGTPQ